MYCNECKFPNEDGEIFCKRCGNKLVSEKIQSQQEQTSAKIESPYHIILSWIMTVLCFFTTNILGAIIYLVTTVFFICSLIIQKNKAGKINGIIMLVIVNIIMLRRLLS